MTWSVRTRLTFWNALVTASIMVGMGAIAYFALGRALLNRVDAVLDFEFKETVERLENIEIDGQLGNIPEAFLEEFLLRVTDASGKAWIESPKLNGLALEPLPTQRPTKGPSFETTELESLGEQRMVHGRISILDSWWTVVIATSLDDYRRELAYLRNILLLLFPVNLLLAAVAGYGLAGRALAPITRMTQTAQRISGSNLDERIETDRADDELGRLAGTLNAMLDRLARSLESTRRFTADASHEFMTPLAQIRTEAEVALQSERPAQEYADVLRSIIEEVERLGRLAKQLLSLAKEDGQAIGLQLEDCPLESILRVAVSAAGTEAEQAGVTLGIGSFQPVTLSIDPDRLRQVLDNLIHNAIQYNRPGGRVEVSLRTMEDKAVIAISDTGIGIPNESLPLVFERFYRVDPARNWRTGGTGLGLSISSMLVEKMNGRINVESTVGQGSTFRIVLPLSSCAKSPVPKS